MRTLDWRRLLDENRVTHIDRGPNVKRGELNIKCPFCGSADPSFHMGLNLQSGWWACWRNESHRGKSPLRLIMALLKVPYWRAREIAGLGADHVDPEGFDAVAARLLGRTGLLDNDPLPRARRLTFPRGFTPLEGKTAWRHLRYLEDERKFWQWVPDLVYFYQLKQCHDEPQWNEQEHRFEPPPWNDRVIIPYHLEKALVTWTGRAIVKAKVRYRDLSVDESLIPPKETLYNYDCIMKGGRILIGVEGPVDALKIDFFGRGVGVRSVAFSTNSMSEAQVFMLEEAAESFDRILFMLDQASSLGIVDSMRLRQKIAHIPNSGIIGVPLGLKDAGELSPTQAVTWTDNLIKEHFA